MIVAIIGGYGKMGAWFSGFFKNSGHEVIISGRNVRKARKTARELGVRYSVSNQKAVEGADMVVISVIVDQFEDVVRKLAPSIKPGQKVIDITSVKSVPVAIMKKYLSHADILGTHPMFGPGIKSPEGQNFILTPTNDKERHLARQIEKMLKSKGFKVIYTSPEKHDEAISRIMSLTHFVGFVTADSWKELEIEKFSNMGSTSFRLLKQFVNSIVDQSPEIYSYLQTGVPNVSKYEGVFANKARIWADMAGKRRRKELMKKMTQLKSYIKEIE